MAAAVVLSSSSTWTAERRDMFTHLMKALNGDQHSLKRLSRGLMGIGHQGLDLHDMRVEATTDSNDAAGSSNIALDLSARGLIAGGPLALNERRDIIVECIVTNTTPNPDVWYHWLQRTTVGNVAGELVIIGQNPQFITDLTATFSATSTGTTVAEVAAGCVPPAWWKGAGPVAADLSSNATTIQFLGANSPVGSITGLGFTHTPSTGAAANARVLEIGNASAANGTLGLFVSDVATPTAANFTSGDNFTVSARITPPIAATLSINSTPTPDTLILSLVGISASALQWHVGVSIGDAYVIT